MALVQRVVAFAAILAMCAATHVRGANVSLGESTKNGNPVFSDATFTVSGISAGGAMAVQYEVAYSAIVRAAGIIAGVPYYCGRDDVYVALDCMSAPYGINDAQLITHMRSIASPDGVDGLDNLRSHAVLLFSGTQDSVVSHGTMVALAQQYNALGLPKLPRGMVPNASASSSSTAGVQVIFDVPAEHSWITNFYGNSCGHLGSPYVNNCGIDFAGEFLLMAWRHMQLPFNGTIGLYNSANLQPFSQSHFGASPYVNSLDTIGYVYVPQQCQEGSVTRGSCNVHVNFHGCEQQRTLVSTDYVSHTGLNEWGESNNIVVIYPQTVASQAIPYNPKGCFDWWGYAGSGYATKGGAQMQVVNGIVEYLLQHGTLPVATADDATVSAAAAEKARPVQ